MTDIPHVFGYGSLVNTRTHDYSRFAPAQLKGWRRVWRHTPLRPVAFLTVVRDRPTTIEGLLAGVPGTAWADLDAREYAYDRHDVRDQLSTDVKLPDQVATYAVPDDAQSPPDTRHPILLSYLDVVVQGYHDHFGEDGVTRFFETTDGWEAPILDDRTTPRYPRAQRLESAQTALVDRWLERLSAQVEKAV